jgi:phosphatidylserine/phosphatidylglycerophosphate/cardiolipin synthase-like enzyme
MRFLLVLGLSAVALAAPLRTTSFNSQIFCWIYQECRGLVEPNSYGESAAKLDAALKKAKNTVDIAIFGLRQQDWFLDTLDRLKKKGVKIRVVTDQKTGKVGEWNKAENFVYGDIHKLVEIVGEENVQVDLNKNGSVRTGSFMHNKFIVIDGKSVWTGSTNISHTELGAEYNANVSLLLHAKEVADLFTKEFEQMFVEKKFSIHKSKHHQKTIEFENSKVDVLFSPQDDVIDNGILPLINAAKSQIDVGVFFLTSVKVADALALAAKNGIKVRVIHDALAERHPYAVTDVVRKGGGIVRVENWGGKMHMKTMIVDRKHALVGSMNFSNAGDSANDESVVVVWDHPHLASDIGSYFEELWISLDGVKGSPRAESFDSINSCFDGIDNNHSGRIDDC